MNTNKNKFKSFKININNNKVGKNCLKSLLKYIIFFIIFPVYFSKEKNKFRKLNLDCQAIVTIKGNGDQSYYSIDAQNRPETITVQGVSNINYDKWLRKVYALENEINNITLIWNYQPTNLNKMFFNLKNITHVYFKGFDSSQVTNMNEIFRGCTSLISIDFTDFNTSSAQSMINMFLSCTSLNSLDLSGFIAPQLTSTRDMFKDCSSLITLNLSNFQAPILDSMETMFAGCSKLENLDLTNFNTSTVTKMNSLFYGCKSLSSIELINFDTSSVDNMGGMFRDCTSLTSIDLSYFDTSSVTSMTGMFQDSKNLISVNLGNLDTSSLLEMNNMFYECQSLKNLNVSNLDVSKVTNMENMFYDCKSLIILDLSSFVTSSLKTTKNLFNGCSSLISIDLSNFDTSKVEDMSLMFYKCTNLISLNLINFDTSSVSSTTHDIFNDIDYNLIFCSSSKISGISNHIKFTSNCNNTCFQENKKIKIENKSCTLNCAQEDIYNLEYKDICYSTCPDDTHPTSDNPNLCVIEPEGYYLDGDIYKPCFTGCKSCFGEGEIENHKCNECDLNYITINEEGKENNCYINCIFYYYFDESDNNQYKCTTTNECPNTYNKKISQKGKCIDDCSKDDKYKFEYNNECFEKCPNNSYGLSTNIYICLSEPDSYYLDSNNLYQKCYSSCKKCTSFGDDDDHNCLDCLLNYKKINEFGKGNNCYIDCGDNYYYFDNEGNYNCIESDLCREKQMKLIDEKKKCIDNCNNDDTYKLEYDNKCYDECPPNTFINVDNEDICQSNPEGYYLDVNIYRKCYETCKTCNKEGSQSNHNCINCIEDYFPILNSQGGYNCFPKCNFYYFFDSFNNYQCTATEECPKEQNKLIKEKSKCINDCSKDDTYIYEDKNICVKFLPEKGIIVICPINLPFEKNRECIEQCTAHEFLMEECKLNNNANKTAQDDIAKKIKEGIEGKNLEEILNNIKEDKNDYIIESSDIKYQLTTSDNQNKNEYDNMTTILLGDCEERLKIENHIDPDETLIIFKYDVYEEGLLIPTIEYEIYNPLTLEPLDLNICKETKISISIPVKIDEDNLFKYNSSDDYYNDICNTYTTDSGTDIMVKDRQKEFNKNHMSLCESNCEYTKYEKKTKKAFCRCEPKIILNSIEDIKNNKDKLIKHFLDIKSFINFNILKCYEVLFDKKNLVKNIGSYFLLSVIFIEVILVFTFIFRGYNILYTTIQQLIQNKRSVDKINSGRKSRKNISNIYQRKEIKKNKAKNLHKKNLKNCPPLKRIKNKNLPKSALNDDNTSMKTNSKLEFKLLDHKFGKVKKIKQKLSHNNLKRKQVNFDNDDENKNIKNIKSYINKMKISNFTDYELNSLLYEEALEIDKRTYTQYYTSLLKQKHLLIFTFCNNNDYNSKIIKIFIFFFSLALYLSINALFFNYEVMNSIYASKGDYDFILQIPKIIYSTLISAAINMIIKTLSLSQKNIVELKREKNNLVVKGSKVIKCINLKLILFFIVSFILLFSFWYYLGCFCAVYKNTQMHLISDALISFLITLVYPIFLNIFPGIFRISSLKSVNKNKECIYKLSQIIQMI